MPISDCFRNQHGNILTKTEKGPKHGGFCSQGAGSGQSLVISSLNLADLLTDSHILSDFHERTTPGKDSEPDASYLLSVLTDLVERSSMPRNARDNGIVCLYTCNHGSK